MMTHERSTAEFQKPKLCATRYLYDSDGRRVAKMQNGSIVKQFYYDAAGQEIVETNGSGTLTRAEIFAGGRHLATGASNATYFNHADWLGTERVRTNSFGAVCETITSLPFGDGESTSGSCTPTPNFFTGKQRDSESGLDYFGARYYGSSLGRFMTPDPLMASARPADPQSWNRYAYVLNNPLRLFDPDGLEDQNPDCKQNPNNCRIKVRVNVIVDKNANEGKGLTAKEKQKLEQGLLAQAKREFGKSNIELETTYTQGSLDRDTLEVTGAVKGAVNVLAADYPPPGMNAEGTGGVAYKSSGLYLMGIGVEQSDPGTINHEFAHTFLGHPDISRSSNPIGGFFQNFFLDMSADTHRFFQYLGVSQSGFREGAKRFSVPPNPEANKPKSPE